METIETTHLTWKDVCEDPALRDLPYKIELTANGTLIMSPTRLKHGQLQFALAELLKQQTQQKGQVVTECAIRTNDGTRVADVGWFSQERWELVAEEYDASVAPEICVEVLSPGNTSAEMAMKRELYFTAGAHEVWICDIAGVMHFFAPEGRLSRSVRVPDFPEQFAV